MNYKIIILIFCLSILRISRSFGQNEDNSVYNLSIKDLISSEVSLASKTEQTLNEAPAIITVITADQMRRRGANTLFEGLDLVPGFTAFRTTNGDRSMVVRGVLSLDGILVMMDGVPLNDPIDGSFSFYDIPLNSIEKVEIIRGPGSALHGGYALVAVINILLKYGNNNEESFEVDLLGAQVADFQTGKFNSNIYYSKSKNNSNLSIGVGFLEDGSQEFKITSDKNNVANKSIGLARSDLYYFDPLQGETMHYEDGSAVTKENFRIINGHVGYLKGPLKLSGFVGYRKINPLFSYRNSTWWDDPYVREDQVYRWFAQYEFKSQGNWTIQPRFYGSYLRRKTEGDITGRFAGNSDLLSINQIKYGLGEIWGDGRFEERNHHTLTTTAEVEFDLEITLTNRFTAGLVFENSHIGGVSNRANFRSAGKNDAWKTERSFYDETAPDFPETTEINDFTNNFPWISNRSSIDQDAINSGLERQVIALYLQDLWKLNKNMSLILGVRFSNYSDFGLATNPRMGFVVNKGPHFFKLLYGSAFRPPAFSQLFDQNVVESQGKIQLQGNSQLKASEIQSFEFATGYNNNSLLIKMSSYYFKTDNEIVFDQTFSKWSNAASREGVGGELEFNFIYRKLSVENSFSFYHTSGINDGIGASIYPRIKYNFGINYLSNKWNLFSGLIARLDNRRETIDSREDINNIFDLKLSVNHSFSESINFKLMASNLLNQNIIDATPMEFNILDDIPRNSRTIWLGVTAKF